MKSREVIFSPEAIEDLDTMYLDLAGKAGTFVADSYMDRLKEFIYGFDLAAERGTLRNNIRKGLRIVGFERRVTVAFMAEPGTVTIIRVFRGGQDWQRLLHS